MTGYRAGNGTGGLNLKDRWQSEDLRNVDGSWRLRHRSGVERAGVGEDTHDLLEMGAERKGRWQ